MEENIKHDRPFRWTAVLIAPPLNLFRLILGVLDRIRQISINGNFTDIDGRFAFDVFLRDVAQGTVLKLLDQFL